MSRFDQLRWLTVVAVVSR